MKIIAENEQGFKIIFYDPYTRLGNYQKTIKFLQDKNLLGPNVICKQVILTKRDRWTNKTYLEKGDMVYIFDEDSGKEIAFTGGVFHNVHVHKKPRRWNEAIPTVSF